MSESRKQYRARMRAKHGADWYKRPGLQYKKPATKRKLPKQRTPRAPVKPKASISDIMVAVEQRIEGREREQKRESAALDRQGWPRSIRTKDGVTLERDPSGTGAFFEYQQLKPYDYAVEPSAYAVSTAESKSGGTYKLSWGEEDQSGEEEFWEDWEGDDYIPIWEVKVILKGATQAQILKKIRSTNRPRLIKYNRGRR